MSESGQEQEFEQGQNLEIKSEIKKSEDPLRERLTQLVPVFLEIRKRMGIKENIGFGFLPKVHGEGYSLGSLPEITRSKKGKINYSVPKSFGIGADKEELSEEEAKNILVMPKVSKGKGNIVSIVDLFYEERNTKMTNLMDAPDDVFVGIIAHELAHSYNSRSKFPPEISNILGKRYKKKFPDNTDGWRYDTHNEQEIDIITSLFGYKKQVIAKIDFMIDRFSKFGPYFKEKQHTIKSLEDRKQQVLEYCSLALDTPGVNHY